MASQAQRIHVHFSFGPHFSKSHAQNAMQQFRQKGPFDIYSPEVALLEGQGILYAQHVKIKNEIIRRALQADASKTKVPKEFFEKLGETGDFNEFLRAEFELAFQAAVPYAPLLVREIPASMHDHYRIRERAGGDIAWEQEFVAMVRLNTLRTRELLQDSWPRLTDKDCLRIFCRFGTEHAPLYALAQKIYEHDPTIEFSYSFDRKKHETEFKRMTASGTFEHANRESRIQWMEYVSKNPGLASVVDDIKQLLKLFFD